uniref:Uncharacterized protein n=1 Tax=Plectus sambesii TaxID=2011161 RepID=A0A914WXG2_9BILA
MGKLLVGRYGDAACANTHNPMQADREDGQVRCGRELECARQKLVVAGWRHRNTTRTHDNTDVHSRNQTKNHQTIPISLLEILNRFGCMATSQLPVYDGRAAYPPRQRHV